MQLRCYEILVWSWLEMTKNLTKTILEDLDSIIKYNIKQLMYYLNKNQVLRQILVLKQNLIKEKFDVKAEVERKITSSSKTSLRRTSSMMRMRTKHRWSTTCRFSTRGSST